jgi:hypothetical protein
MYHICVCFLFLRTSCNKEESDIEWYQEIKINQLPNITYIKKTTKFTKNNKVQKDILFFIYIGVFKRIEQ